MSIQIEQYQDLDIMSTRKNPFKTIQQKNPNRLYLSWKNSNGTQCKMIGPQTKCFCNHRFKQHQHLNPKNNKTQCKDHKCKCKNFQYIPTHGSYDFKCLCKHSYKQHDRNSKLCLKQKCNECSGFASTWTCSCGQRYDKHQTVSQTFQQRKMQGKSVNDMDRMVNQLQGNTRQGSLYKPIKLDRQAKLRKKNESISKYYQTPSKSTIQNEEQIQQYDFSSNNIFKINRKR